MPAAKSRYSTKQVGVALETLRTATLIRGCEVAPLYEKLTAELIARPDCSVADLERVVRQAAEIAIKYPQYLSLFERMETELEAARRRSSTMERARAIASGEADP